MNAFPGVWNYALGCERSDAVRAQQEPFDRQSRLRLQLASFWCRGVARAFSTERDVFASVVFATNWFVASVQF